MKIYPNNFFNNLAKLKDKTFKGILLYGPNQGLLSYFFNEIKNYCNYEIQTKSGSDWLKAHNLTILLNTGSLFASKELIRITEPGQSMSIEAMDAICSQNSSNLLIIMANESPPSSTLRKNFENHVHLLSLACYEEDLGALLNFIDAYGKSKNSIITKEAAQYLASNFTNRQQLKMELDKLHCWLLNSKESIGLKEVQDCNIGGDFDKIDELVFALIKNDAEAYFSKLANIDFANTAPILLIRTFLKYYVSLYYVILAKQTDARLSLQSLIKELKPPIFFKYVDNFTSAAEKSSMKNIAKAIVCLVNAEKELKANNISAKLVYEELFFNLK